MCRNEAGLGGAARWNGPARWEVIRWALSCPARAPSSWPFPIPPPVDVGRTGWGRVHNLLSVLGLLCNLRETRCPISKTGTQPHPPGWACAPDNHVLFSVSCGHQQDTPVSLQAPCWVRAGGTISSPPDTLECGRCSPQVLEEKTEVPSIEGLPTTTQLVSELGPHAGAPLCHDRRQRGRGFAEHVLEQQCLTPAGKHGNTTVISPKE